MSSAQQDNLLARGTYDADAASLRSTSDPASGSEDELHVEKSRSTLELEDHDASVLREEEERESLLAKKGPFDGFKHVFQGSLSDVGFSLGDREARRQRRKERRGSRRGLRGENAEEGQLMFEMEEGFKDISSRSSSTDSHRLDRAEWDHHEKKVRLQSVKAPSLLTPACSPTKLHGDGLYLCPWPWWLFSSFLLSVHTTLLRPSGMPSRSRHCRTELISLRPPLSLSPLMDFAQTS